jgi:hypothetical protein
VLFWRSMPVSDTRTVLVKLLVGLVLVPLGTYLLTAITSLIASAILQLRQPLAPQALAHWSAASWLRIQGIMLYALIATLLWFLPYASYLVLASAWARRSPAAWAAIPPILLLTLEPLIFGTHYAARMIGRGWDELMGMIFHTAGDDFIPDEFLRATDAAGLPHSGFLDPTPLLQSPKLWLGLAFAALLTVLTIRLRRYRED